MEIVANEYKLKNKPSLKLLFPKGGEKFAPCEKILIE
jgi:hypothetical protein